MALLKKQKTTSRQKEIRRSRAERLPGWLRQLQGRIRPQPLILLLLCALAAAVIVNTGPDGLEVRTGQRLARTATARVAFRVADEARTQAMRVQARNSASYYYTLDVSLLKDIRGKLLNALPLARQHAENPERLRTDAAEIKVLLDDAGLQELVRLAGQEKSTAYENYVEQAIRELREQPLVETAEEAPRRSATHSVLVEPEQATERSVSNQKLVFANSAESVTRVANAAAQSFPPALRDSISTSLRAMLAREDADGFKPLYRYDRQASARAAQAAETAVPTQYVEYPVDSPLAHAGVLTAEDMKLLRREHEHYLAQRDLDPELRAVHQREALARGIIAFLVVFGLGGYIMLWHLRQPRYTRAPRAATALSLVLILMLARWAYLDTPTAYVAVGAQAFAVALLAITSGRSAAQATSALLALMITIATRESIGFLVVLAAVSVVLFLGLRDVRNRGRIIAVGGLAALVAGLTTLLVGLVDGQSLQFVFWNRAIWSAGMTLGAAFLVEGVLPGIERLFGITTNMTLLEWCDPNKAVLRMLAAESPGTYNHSLLVGALADAAADAIGANGLLARAGAYYHDIGKINKPEYFIENQAMGVGNRHERLSPAMSHLILIGHVKDGIEMAKAYSVPSSLHPFIPEHHGTTVIEYFYHAANQARRPGDPEVSDTQFRYPGPKPQSRETAIVMMCDSVEGAVRAMPEPTPNRIEDTVDRMIQKRLIDGQFDECEITFRELAAIRASLVKSLISIYHGRIKYPSSERTEPQPETRNAS